MAKPRVLITAFFLKPGGEVDRRLQEAGFDTVFNPYRGRRTEGEMIDLLQGVQGAIVSMDPFTDGVFAAAPQLKVVSRTGVGYDAIDVKAATARKVAVCTTPGANQHAVADYTMALMLAVARRLVENLTEVSRGKWTHFEGRDVHGATLGIVGLGQIGKEVARRARGFDMRVLAYDPMRDETFAARHQVSYVSLEQLLQESDFVTLHALLDRGTRHLINAERLALMKTTAYLINAARGGIVDTEALALACREKRIGGAALDVFEEEPLAPDSPLRGLDNVYLSPHSAAATSGAMRAAGIMAADNAILVLKGERPLYAVNPEALVRGSTTE